MLRKSLFLLLMLLPFFMFGTNKVFPEKILFNITFNEKTKINGKYLKSESKEIKLNEAKQENIEQIEESLSDLSSDEQMPQTETKEENSEETENVTETNDIYLSEEEEKFYLNVLDKNKSDLEMKLFKFIQGKNIKTTFFRSMENPANTPEIHVFIDNYQSGEFNLIKNVNTQMTYIVEIQNRNKKNIAKIKKKYIVRTVSSKPLEAQRLSELNERFIKDIYRLMTRYLQDKM